ncbi:hypothetical protein DFS33DRAFT_1386520 [Desarmillaria ectypa]|nr:hypothetical protein DFS33DRAFT_1386520 [Desarmillaria ectypa]
MRAPLLVSIAFESSRRAKDPFPFNFVFFLAIWAGQQPRLHSKETKFRTDAPFSVLHFKRFCRRQTGNDDEIAG